MYPCVSHYVKNDSPKGKVYTLNEQQIKMIFEKNRDCMKMGLKTGLEWVSGLFTNDSQNCYA